MRWIALFFISFPCLSEPLTNHSHLPVERGTPGAFQAPLLDDISPFYESFAKDGVVRIYMGYGKDGYQPKRYSEVAQWLYTQAWQRGIRFHQWTMQGNRLSFVVSHSGIRYDIRFGNERNEYIAAYQDYEVIHYHGHSRYGRGPAFLDYSNYFRMGTNFETIEVDTRNPYFVHEPLVLTDLCPALELIWKGSRYFYQYRGEMDHSSHLSKDAYTRRIEGNGKDLKALVAADFPQIFFYKSCTNISYWQTPLRDKFPDPNQKFIFGTTSNTFWSSQPDVTFLLAIIEQQSDPNAITSALDATKDCEQYNCWTTY